MAASSSPGSLSPKVRRWLAVVSGALLVLCFPGFDQGWLAWVALVPLFVALLDAEGAVGPRQGAGLGFLAGAAFLGGLLYWVWIFGWYAWLALTVYQALWIALFGTLAAVLLRRTSPALASPALAAAWTLVEWARSLGGLGLTWGDLAVSQHRVLPMLQMLDWTGPWGLSFLIALVNASLASVVVGQRQGSLECGGLTPLSSPVRPDASQRERRKQASALQMGLPAAAGWLIASVLVVGALTARGAWLLGRPVRANAPTLPVAVVQGNVDQDALWDGEYFRRAMGPHVRLTMEAARAGARLIVWSETSLPGELRNDRGLRSVVGGLARRANAELIVGSTDRIGDKSYNRAFLVDREGRLQGGYAKRHLVPYGECVPMRAWLPFVEKLHVTAFDLTPGEGFFPLRGDHKLGAVICFESAFPHIARAMAGQGAEILVEVTNDTWFRRTSAAAQHAAMAPLRAVETRRALARATATGISTLVDDHGRVRRSLGLFQEGYLLERLPLRQDLTLYTRLGDWPVFACLLFCFFSLTPRRRCVPRS
jgi:apolipoprotein N-acyltransferase